MYRAVNNLPRGNLSEFFNVRPRSELVVPSANTVFLKVKILLAILDQ